MATTPGADMAEKPKLQSAFNLFKPSMDALGRNFGTFACILLLPFALLLAGVVPGLLSGSNSAHAVSLTLLIIVELAALAFIVLLGPALTYTELKSARGEKVAIKEAFRGSWHFLLRWVGLSICLGIIMIVSFLLLIVPFFFMLRRYFLAPYYLVDRDLGIMDSLKESAQESKRHRGSIWGLLGVEALISLVSAVPFVGWVAGTILSVLYFCAPAVRYLEITKAETIAKPNPRDVAPPANAKPAM